MWSRYRRTTLALALSCVCAATALAHSFDPTLVDIREITPGIYDLRWQMTAAAEGGEASSGGLIFPSHCRIIARQDARPTRIDCGKQGLRGQPLSLAPNQARAEILLRVRMLGSDVISGVLSHAAPTFLLPGLAVAAGSESSRGLMTGYIALGIEHILGGADHLLFVLGLMLLVRGWRRLLATLTAFTMAHSLTLALAILAIVQVPPAPVEAAIALSIVLLAAELARAPGESPTLARRWPWGIAFVFGLLHGLGFAGALRQVGLPAGQLPLALLAFNVGVELGQIAFVGLALLPVLIWQRMGRRDPRLGLVPAYAIGCAAAFWMFQRLDSFSVH